VAAILVGGGLVAALLVLSTDDSARAGRFSSYTKMEQSETAELPNVDRLPLANTTFEPADFESQVSDSQFEVVVDDDGRLLWASPTNGHAISFEFLPPGCQMFVFLRPSDLSQHPEWDKLRFGLGASGAQAIERLEHLVRMPLAVIQELMIGIQIDRGERWLISFVVKPRDSTAAHHVVANLPNAIESKHAAVSFRVLDGRCYFTPSSSADILVIVPQRLVAEVIDMGEASPPMRRNIEQLVAATDHRRHVTLLAAPNFLTGDGRGMFAGPMERLRKPLAEFLGEGSTAAALSIHWSDAFFAELLVSAQIETSPERLSEQLARRVSQLPGQIEQFVMELSPHRYARALIARLPAMVRSTVTYTRHDYTEHHARLRTLQPVVAAHNLLLAVELALAETWTQVDPSTSNLSSGITNGLTLEQRLEHRTSLNFPRETLETALEMLASDVGVKIDLLGADLQQEGITKNQSFGLDLADRHAREILVEILRQANPDKSAVGPSDPRQKLVYTLRDGRIVVTTRAAAANRGEVLPDVFRSQGDSSVKKQGQ
jgi:hypothetical protein